MASVVFVETNGNRHEVETDQNESLMQIAIDNGVPGIDGDCGGACACGTCHVLIDDQWLKKMNPVNESEENMIEMAPDRSEQSRLACQIQLNESLDGIVVHLPEYQM
ncbi:MAG: 2Fe-2S ferredoxin [Cellvibrionaceae bacterium]|nr:2Fe-2S ferredoxin [Cellvibrionaceae bacterium]|tara:strand:- start:1415 stop:1735 length:321 start_codon:yes stop_codon:yes gene_type:complete